ncbi:MAG: hydrogenase maturation nickel metallochaperone HypA, partial [Candidatus Sumerlaeaceae bacterium]|nr:hydrogenase maturation nickel metallochaperone HypA [Candidatus Sumerlaeaceae bacterium]
MHEYSLMQDVVASLTASLEREGITRKGAVKEIILRIGALDIHSEASFRQAFEVLTQSTLLEGAQLKVEIMPAQYKCQACGYEGRVGVGDADGHLAEPVIECAHCGHPCVVTGG